MIETSNLLTDAMSQALETMAFLTIMPLEDDLVVPEETLLAEISFAGPKRGTIQILAGSDFSQTLAENMGALDEADEKSCYDALKELANVTCGLLLPQVASSPVDVFDVTVPAVKSDDNSPQWDEFVAEQNSCILNIEGYMVAAKLIVENKE